MRLKSLCEIGKSLREIRKTLYEKLKLLCENEKEKKLLPHGVFVFGHPSRYESRKTGLNFVERTTRGAVLMV